MISTFYGRILFHAHYISPQYSGGIRFLLQRGVSASGGIKTIDKAVEGTTEALKDHYLEGCKLGS